MKIFVNNNEETFHQVKKTIAPLSARKEIDDNIAFEEGNLKQGSIQDKFEAMKNLRRWNKLKDKSRPEKLTIDAKNILWKRAKKLKDEFTVGMLSRDELHPVKMTQLNGTIKTVVNEDKMRSVNSVQRQIQWNKQNEHKVREFKNIMRHLCPDNPAATDIEKFRPTRRIG